MPRATISYNNNTQIQKLIKKKKKKKNQNQIIEKHLFISTTIEVSSKSSSPKQFIVYLVLKQK